MAKRKGQGREGRKKDPYQGFVSGSQCSVASRERTTGVHMRASTQTHTSNNAFAQHPLTVRVCVFLVIPSRLSLSLPLSFTPPPLFLSCSISLSSPVLINFQLCCRMRLGHGSVCSCNFSPHLLWLPVNDSMLLAFQEGEVNKASKKTNKGRERETVHNDLTS